MSVKKTSGFLPTSWNICELGDLATINYGYTESASKEKIGPKFLRITDIQEGQVNWDDVPYCKIDALSEAKYVLESGDIVFARTGATTGKSFLIANPPSSVCASYLIRLRPNHREVSSQYLNYFFQSDFYWQQIRSAITGTAQGGVNASKLAVLKTFRAPLDEQTKIVEIIEEQLSHLDAALESVRIVRTKAARFRRSLLHAAFNGALTGSDGLVGELPEGWTRIELGDVLQDAQPGFASGAHNSQGKGVVHMRPMNVSRAGNLDFSETKYVEDDSPRRLRRGDILFNNTNSAALIGKTAFVDTDQELAFSNHMTRLRPDTSRILANFLSSQLHAFWLDGFFEKICSNHVNQASVSTKRLKSVEVNFPPLQEQEIIVELLEEQLSRLDASLAVADEIERRSSALRRSLLHAAFTGELTKEWREGANV